jgi:arylsulfatase A-like enzyme
VTDIAPTLLALAAVAQPGARYRDQAVETMSGRSLLPVIKGEALAVRGPNEHLGYELSGNLAMFRGDLKLVRNSPPVGDGNWHLYDIGKDPGETRDLQAELPEQFAAMKEDYAKYAKSHGVLPIPDGYNPVQAVFINTIYNYWLPTYGATASMGSAAVLLAAMAWWWRRRRAQRTGA